MKEEDLIELLEDHKMICEGHFDIGQGFHSEYWIDGLKIAKHPGVSKILARELWDRTLTHPQIKQRIKVAGSVWKALRDVVFVSHKANARIIRELVPALKLFGAQHITLRMHKNTQAFQRADLEVLQSRDVILLDDFLTFGRQLIAMQQLVAQAKARTLFSLVVWDRSGKRLRDIEAVALISRPLPQSLVTHCKLCRKNHPLVNPVPSYLSA